MSQGKVETKYDEPKRLLVCRVFRFENGKKWMRFGGGNFG
jgi:hypothetical protein